MEYKPKAKREMKTNAKGKEYAFVSKEELAAFKKAGLGSTLTDLMNYEAKMRKGSSKTRSMSSGSGPTKAQQDALDKKMMELQKKPSKPIEDFTKGASKRSVAAPKAMPDTSPKKIDESGKVRNLKPMSPEKRRLSPDFKPEMTKAKKSTAPSEGNAGAPLRAVESMLGIDYGSKTKKTAEDLKKQRRMRNERLGMSSGGAAKKKK